jgi:hypothetical protein
VGQPSGGTGEQTLRRCVGRCELEPGSAGAVRDGHRGEEPDAQPIAPAISRSSRRIQTACGARQEALLCPSEAQFGCPKEKEAVAATGTGPAPRHVGSAGVSQLHARALQRVREALNVRPLLL